MTVGPRPSGELCIVLHSHMPYVEGFGTWPFGEEWLLEAMASSYLPLIEVLERHAERGARGIATVGVTPVLADQLALPEVGERFLRFMRGTRRECHSEDAAGLERAGQHEAAAALRLSAADYEHAALEFERRGGDLLGALRRAARPRRGGPVGVVRDACRAAAARDGQRRADAGRGRRGGSHASASGRGAAASGCPSAPTGRASRTSSRAPACGPSASTRRGRAIRSTTSSRSTLGGTVAVPLDWSTISLVWDDRGYPSRSGLPRLPRADGQRHAGLGERRPRRTTATPRTRGRASTRAHFVEQVIRRARRIPGRAGAARPCRLRARHGAARPLVVRGAGVAGRGDRGGRPPGARAGHAARRARAPRAAPGGRSGVDLGHRQGPAHLGLPARRRPRLGGARGGAAARRRARLATAPTAARRPRGGPRASCSRCSPATGRS